jgi:hypothetical protein
MLATSVRGNPFVGLVDDAAIFPPGELAMTDAVPAHEAHLGAWYADLVGPFVCSDRRLPELQQVLSQPGRSARLQVSIVVQGGAGAVEPALTWAGRAGQVEVATVEIALRDEEDLRHNAARMSTVLDASLPEGACAYVEMPRLYGAEPSADWLAALDEVAAAGLGAKFRTGGLEPDAFPPAHEVATAVAAALDREVPFKCTAGLHHALPYTDPTTGFEHHGFLNVLLATRLSLDGASVVEVAEVLDRRDPVLLASALREAGTPGLESARRWFRSFGSCSVVDPVGDLVALGLLPGGPQ